MLGWTAVLTLLFGVCTVVFSSNIGNTRQDIVHYSSGGYGNILIAIDENVPEDLSLLTYIKDLIKRGSKFMWKATKYQKNIANYTILIPATWSHDASWDTPTVETFERARIVVAPPNEEWEDRPYTKQPGECSEEGDYIHYTPNYIKNNLTEFGPKEKTFVHEWSHMKWGLADEYARDDDDRWYMVRRRIQPTRCNSLIDGVIFDDSSATGACIFDLNGMPTITCEFRPSPNTQVVASIMYAEYLDSVDSFCEDGESATQFNSHDYSAPNRQNKKCEQSTWSSLSNHRDFATPTQPNSEAEPTVRIVHDYDIIFKETTTVAATTTVAPTTTVATTTTEVPTTTDAVATTTVKPTTTTAKPTDGPVQTQKPTTVPLTSTTEFTEKPVPRKIDVVCLVLDVSGSMGVQNRIGIMGSAVANYLRNYLDDGSVVGIVSFSSRANVLAPMTVVGDTTRDELVSKVPTTVGGGTSIGAGLLKCGEVLSAYAGKNTAATRMFVLSDGKESAAPSVNSTLPSILELGIMVDTIAYSQQADPILGRIATSTGGYSFYFSGSVVSTAMQDALLATIERRRNKDSPITLVSDGLVVAGGADYTRTVTLDNSIGRGTRLVFTYYNDIDVSVTAAQGNKVTMTHDRAFKLITADIDGIVNGDVTFTLDNKKSSNSESVVVSATSRVGVPGQDPITVSARMNKVSVKFTATSTVNIYADVYRGLTPVSGVNVSAVFELSNGAELVIPMKDNGAGPDSAARDGVYTATLLSNQLVGNGFYSLKIDVDGVGELYGGTFSGAPRGQCNACKKQSRSTGYVSRVASGGAFQVQKFNALVASQDNFAPNRISDLRLSRAIYGTDYITMSWTAPGDDLNYGTASGYEISVWYDTHLNKTSPDLFLVPDSAILTNQSSLLVPAGEQLNLTVLVGTLNHTFFGLNETEGVDLDTYYFRMRAFDDANNKATWSNEISASFVDPADYEGGKVLLSTTQVQQPRTTPKEITDNTAMVIGLAVGATACMLGLVAGIVTALLVCYNKGAKVHADPPHSKRALNGDLKSLGQSTRGDNSYAYVQEPYYA